MGIYNTKGGYNFKCKACSTDVEMEREHVAWYKNRKFKLPSICASCIEKRRLEKVRAARAEATRLENIQEQNRLLQMRQHEFDASQARIAAINARKADLQARLNRRIV